MKVKNADKPSKKITTTHQKTPLPPTKKLKIIKEGEPLLRGLYATLPI